MANKILLHAPTMQNAMVLHKPNLFCFHLTNACLSFCFAIIGSSLSQYNWEYVVYYYMYWMTIALHFLSLIAD